jgi:hypothetical protein
MSGIKIPPGKRRCSDDNHEGERVLPESEFQRDRAQASGFALQVQAMPERPGAQSL